MVSLSAAIRRTLGVRRESFLVLLLLLQIQFHHGSSQQAYLNDYQSDCFGNHTNILGYSCAAEPLSSCTAYLTFNSTSQYSNITSIASLLAADATAIFEANSAAVFPEGNLLYVPVNCSCTTAKKYYQHNATYQVQTSGETYSTISNLVYERLTGCQAMISQNSVDPKKILVGDRLVAPLMCVCPSANQTKNGFNYIVSYLVRNGESISSIAALFGVDQQRILDANELTSTSTIFALYPLLIPLETSPERIKLNPSSPAPSPSPPPPPPPPTSSSSSFSKKWLLIGIVIGAAIVAFPVLLLTGFLIFRRKRKQKHQPPPAAVSAPASDEYKPLPEVAKDNIPSQSWSVSSDGIRYTIESLTLYKLEALQKATNDFSESNRISGSVFRGEFSGDPAAVKILNGDVSSEINILKQINHSNIIRLSGFCVHGGNTYLVYEFADKGSLRDILHSDSDSDSLGWKQRVQIAYGIADGLNYLHNYCTPPYVHKNISSSNVLLDSNLRAKITNFGLARTVPENDEEGGGMHLTKHVVGAKGYLAPEYIENGLVTPKMDVYAFGMVVLELMSGRTPGGSIGEVLEGENVREKLRRFMDARLSNRYPFDLAYSMAQLARMCVAPDLGSRLSISEALVLLSKIHSSSLDWDPSDELDRSSSLTHGR